jgi:hypothetical protein
MMSTVHRLFLALTILLGLNTRLPAQTITVIPAKPACKICALQLSPVVRLGSAEDSAGFGLTASVVMTRRGQFLVSSGTFVGHIFVYDRNGTFLRSIGRRGGGPGEFNSTLRLHVDATDTVRAIEAGTPRRYHVIAPDNTIRRSVPLLTSFASAVAQPNGTLFAATPTAATLVAEYDQKGQRIKEFGTPLPNANPKERAGFVAIGPTGTRWSLAQDAYVIERWSPDGTRAQRVTAVRNWLPRDPPTNPRDARVKKPASRLVGMLAGPNDQLFVFAVVADANWKPSPPGRDPDPRRVFDTLVELIDARSGSFIASTRFDGLMFPMHGTLVTGMVEDAVGDRRLNVWSLSLLRK